MKIGVSNMLKISAKQFLPFRCAMDIEYAAEIVADTSAIVSVRAAACSDRNCDICEASTCYACKAGYIKDTNGMCQGKSTRLFILRSSF